MYRFLVDYSFVSWVTFIYLILATLFRAGENKTTEGVRERLVYEFFIFILLTIRFKIDVEICIKVCNL
jgi:hypothetical protein